MSEDARIGDTVRVRWPAVFGGPMLEKRTVITLTPAVVRYAERTQQPRGLAGKRVVKSRRVRHV